MGYVLAGFGLTVGVLVGYGGWVLRREQTLGRLASRRRTPPR